MNSLNSQNTLTSTRESLLAQNPDLLFGVYNLKSNDWEAIELELVENTLCLYPNQLENIQGFDENAEITLLDINELRKWSVKTLKGKEVHLSNPILLSGGVIEVYGANKAKGETRDHILLTLRDGGAADSLQYTSVAGRNVGKNIAEEAEREQMEESPFLLQDNEGKYALWIRHDNPDFINTLETSIQNWKKKIKSYQNTTDAKKMSELEQAEGFVKKLFPKIRSLDTMMSILDDVVSRKAYIQYEAKALDAYTGMEDSMRTVKIGENSGRYFVLHDTDNNTIEYRKLERVTKLPDWYTLAGRNTSRLYLESINQRPNTRRLQHNNSTQESKKVVPAVKDFVQKALEKSSN